MGMLGAYLEDPKNGIPQNKKEKTSARGNITKEIGKPSITWKTFIKALRIIGVEKFKIRITIIYRDNTETSHEIMTDLGQSYSPLVNPNNPPIVTPNEKGEK